MRIYVSLLLLSLCSATASAQTADLHKTVYLKDGSNVRGLVTVHDSGGYVMVVDGHHESHYFDTSMVAKIEDKAPRQSGSYDLKPRGYSCNIEVGGSDILAKDNGYNISAASFDVVNSYLFSPYVSLGLGVGGQLSDRSVEMVSAYADSRVYFMRSNISPFLDVAVGYTGMFLKYTNYDDSFNLQPAVIREIDQGLMVNTSLGVRVAVGRKAAITADIGYKLYYLHSSNSYYYAILNDATFNPDAHGYYLFNALTIKAGIQF